MGSYPVNVILRDDGQLPLSTNNLFSIIVIKNINEEKEKKWEKEVEISENLDVKIQYVTNNGKVRIKFNEAILRHYNFTQLHLRDPPVLKFKLWRESEKRYRDGMIESWNMTAFGNDYIDV